MASLRYASNELRRQLATNHSAPRLRAWPCTTTSDIEALKRLREGEARRDQ